MAQLAPIEPLQLRLSGQIKLIYKRKKTNKHAIKKKISNFKGKTCNHFSKEAKEKS